MKKILLSLALALGLVLTGTLVYAQEDATSTVGSDSAMEMDSEPTEEESEALADDAEEVPEEELAEELVVGEVIAVTEDYVVLEDENKRVVKVPITAAVEAQRGRTGAIISLTQLQFGHRVAIAPEGSSHVTGAVSGLSSDSIALRTSSGVQNVPLDSNFKVTQGGKVLSRAALNTLDEEDMVTVITDEDGDVLGVHIVGAEAPGMADAGEDDAEQRGTMMWWIIGLIVLILIVWLVARTKKVE